MCVYVCVCVCVCVADKQKGASETQGAAYVCTSVWRVTERKAEPSMEMTVPFVAVSLPLLSILLCRTHIVIHAHTHTHTHTHIHTHAHTHTHTLAHGRSRKHLSQSQRPLSRARLCHCRRRCLSALPCYPVALAWRSIHTALFSFVSLCLGLALRSSVSRCKSTHSLTYTTHPDKHPSPSLLSTHTHTHIHTLTHTSASVSQSTTVLGHIPQSQPNIGVNLSPYASLTQPPHFHPRTPVSESTTARWAVDGGTRPRRRQQERPRLAVRPKPAPLRPPRPTTLCSRSHSYSHTSPVGHIDDHA